MCGFLAYQGDSLRRDNLEEGLNRLSHRGPDGRGTFVSDNGRTAIGARRLGVIDPDNGNQPMVRQSTVLAFNGTIYNYRSLRNDLRKQGFEFRTRSDTEVLLQGYRARGLDFLGRIEGMFSFVIRDARNDRLVLARDRTGQKPLYYSNIEGGFVAGSEPRALRAFPSVSRTLNIEALPLYLCLQYIPSPESGYRDIRKLPPGHYALVSEGTLQTRQRYWRPNHSVSTDRSPEETQRQLRRKLSDAVRLRRRSDVPLGVFLSGGLDSAILAALLSEQASSTPKTFTLLVGQDATETRDRAQRIARAFGTDHTELRVSGDVKSLLPELIRHHGEPFADSSLLCQYWLARQASDSITVALGGDGADELFGGYSLYQKMAIHEQLKQWIPERMRGWLAGVANRFPNRRQGVRSWDKAALLTQGLDRPAGEWYLRMLSYFQPEGLKRLFCGERTVNYHRPLAFCRRRFDRLRTESPTRTAMAFDIATYLPGDILAKVDTATMMNSMEGRSPFLDSRVVELAASLPLKDRIGRTTSGRKNLLREAFSDRLPEGVLSAPKVGFGIPRERWLRTKLREYAREVLLADRNDGFFKLFNRTEVKRLLDAHQDGTTNHGGRLWALLMLRLWLRTGDARL